MKKTLNLLLICIILFSLFAVSNAYADGTPFTAMGKVTDRYGNGVAGATVTMVDNNYKQVAKTKSDQYGNFEFVSISVDTSTVKVLTTYTDDNGKTYTVPPEWSNWFPASGNININSTFTQFSDYPPPAYGYFYGTVQTGTGSGDRTLDGVVYVTDGEVTYYVKTTSTGSFQFYLKPGTWTYYVQHEENGMIYESQHRQITVTNNLITQTTPTTIVCPLNTPAVNPNPATLPDDGHYNKVNGTVETKDGKPYQGATVSLYMQSDNGSTYLKKSNYVTTTNANGYFEFDGVGVTSDDNKDLQANKNIYVQIDYTDTNGQLQSAKSDTRQLYNPNLFVGPSGMEDSVRNVMFGDKNGIVYLPFAKSGWVSLTSDPPGAAVYVDNQPLAGPDGKQLVTPCTAYINEGQHTIKLSMDGYVDKVGTITMQANTQHDPVFMSLDRPVVPSWVTLIVAIIILLIVIVLIILLLASRRQMLLAPFAGIIASYKKSRDDRRASKEIARAHKAEINAQHRSTEQHHKITDRLEKAREEVHSLEGQIESRVRHQPKREPAARRDTARSYDNTHDYVERDYVDRSPDPAEYLAKSSNKRENKKIFDIKGITNNIPKKSKPYQMRDAQEEKPPVRFANDIYKKPASDVERLPQEQSRVPRKDYNDSLPARDDRMRIPKTAPQRDGTSAVRDREKVLRYIKDHPEGVSFIQMSNDLEIIPNNLTYITKELVINDDIEKIKGLYYYKARGSQADDSSSSVVVWRLDGDK